MDLFQIVWGVSLTSKCDTASYRLIADVARKVSPSLDGSVPVDLDPLHPDTCCENDPQTSQVLGYEMLDDELCNLLLCVLVGLHVVSGRQNYQGNTHHFYGLFCHEY